ncbi:MAG: type II toxin-antitoxin system VapC family toxin [Deltaproteobacteria bacterium]|nr:type II toxin-antitoxin system VapC family toxin [Deltaproteobacteria bacterium]
MAKRYLHEAESDEFDHFLGGMISVSISRLTVVELRCLLGRRRRNHDIDASAELRVVTAFEEDIAQGFLEVHPLEDQHAIRACDLLIRLANVPLRTLDALHLAIATGINASAVATADETFAAAAAALRLSVEWFGAAKRSGRKRVTSFNKVREKTLPGKKNE